jgi:MoaA/NifB/PqqE/SkfB family radical SAM enzyme
MDMEMLEKILSGLPKKNLTICPYLSGEPLIHPKLIEAIGLIKKYGYNHVRFHTNATLLTLEKSEKLINSGLSHIVFSVDGSDKQDFERIRGVSFEKVKDNIYNFLIMNIGAGKKVNVCVQNMIPYGKPLVFNKDLQPIEHLFHEIILDYPHSWVMKGKIQESYEPEFTEIPCFFLKYYMAIASSGNYVACCMCLNEEIVFANIKDKMPKEVWDEYMENLRQKQIRGEYIPICSDCNRYNKGN